MTPRSSTDSTSTPYARGFNDVRARLNRRRDEHPAAVLHATHPLRFEETKRPWPESAQQRLPLSAAASPADSDDDEPLGDAALIFHIPLDFDELGADARSAILDFLPLADVLAMRLVSRDTNETVMSAPEFPGLVNASREYARTADHLPAMQRTVSRLAVLESVARWASAGSVLAFSLGGLARALIALADMQRGAFYAGRTEPEDAALDWARFGTNITVGGCLVLAIAAEKAEQKVKMAHHQVSREHKRAVSVAQANLCNAVLRFEMARVRARRNTTPGATS